MGLQVGFSRIDSVGGGILEDAWPVCRDVAFLEVRSSGGGSVELPSALDGVVLRLQLAGVRQHGCRLRSMLVGLPEMSAGSVVLHDLRDTPAVVLGEPTHMVLILIPTSTLRRTAAEAGRGWSGSVRTESVSADDVVANLVSCLMPELAGEGAAAGLFVEHLALALIAHVASEYGSDGLQARARGGLAGWQVRKAQELLASDLTERIELAAVADQCGLSVSHFSRSFRQSVGTTPHHWLIGRKLEAAKDMLREGRAALAEVALTCGFADQSHFTRVFSREVGCSPGSWRRAVAIEVRVAA